MYIAFQILIDILNDSVDAWCFTVVRLRQPHPQDCGKYNRKKSCYPVLQCSLMKTESPKTTMKIIMCIYQKFDSVYWDTRTMNS